MKSVIRVGQTSVQIPPLPFVSSVVPDKRPESLFSLVVSGGGGVAVSTPQDVMKQRACAHVSGTQGH